ncbi:MAG: helix-turn-helix transcriptional regulator [Gammaproteobacteria bacterium]
MQKISNTIALGQWIRDLRKSQGLTQEELSATSGVGIRFIRELEQGKESCHLGKVLTVIQMLGGTLFAKGFKDA